MSGGGNPTSSQTAYARILQMILTRKIQGGEKLTEERLTDLLGVSRTPVREAIRRLANEGLVVVYPNRQSEVVTLDEAAIQELGTVRMALDVLAAQLAVLNGSNADFMRLRKIADACYEAAKQGDIYERIRLDCDFHLMLTEIGRNSVLLTMQRQLYLKVQLVQAEKYIDVEDSLKKIEGHNSIIEALFSRNEERVIRALQEHLASFYNVRFTPAMA
jgi:DNA-binding GntR family transcriptional regulator